LTFPTHQIQTILWKFGKMKIKNHIIILVTLLLFGCNIHRNSTIEWVKTYGENKWGAKFRDVCLTSKGNFALCGQKSKTGMNKHGWILLVNGETLEIIFEVDVGGEGKMFVQLNSIVEVESGGFLAAGVDSRINKGDFVAVRISSDGELLWTNYYGDDFKEACRDAIQDKNGNYLLAGYNNLAEHNGPKEIWREGYLVQIDEDGKVVWEKTYGGLENREFTSLCEVEGGYLLAGILDGDGWFLKVSEEGEIIWTRTYNRDEEECLWKFAESFNNILHCPDGFLLTGHSSLLVGKRKEFEGSFWMVKVNSRGEQLWEKVYEFGKPGYPKGFISAALMKDGGYVLLGPNSQIIKEKLEFKEMVLRTDNLGEVEWIYEFLRSDQEVCVIELNSVIATPDGGMIVSGTGNIKGREPGAIIIKILDDISQE
jgi:hypothetical protein